MTDDEAWEMLREAVTDSPHCFGINNLETIGLIEVVDEKNTVLAVGNNAQDVVSMMLNSGLVSKRVLKLFGMLH